MTKILVLSLSAAFLALAQTPPGQMPQSLASVVRLKRAPRMASSADVGISPSSSTARSGLVRSASRSATSTRRDSIQRELIRDPARTGG